MDIHIGSKHLRAQVVTAFDVTGREHLVVAIKASWRIPRPGQRPRPIAPQPLVPSDEFYGTPGESPMRYGSDFARHKPRCDILFDAHAHAPAGQTVTELIAGFKLGTIQKALRVTGPRQWHAQHGLSPAQSFTKVALHHGLAFGGTHHHPQRTARDVPTEAEALPENPVGIGWAGPLTLDALDELQAPQIEPLNEPYLGPDRPHTAAALSAVARHWAPRIGWAGTYDQYWQDEVCPFLPEDFDEQYHQCAPLDQQIPYPQGGEDIVLLNLMADAPRLQFKLPPLDRMQVRVLRTNYRSETLRAHPDTLFFEPDAQRFSAVWRASTPIERRIQEFEAIAVGPIDMQWWQEKLRGTAGCVGCAADASAEAPQEDAAA